VREKVTFQTSGQLQTSAYVLLPKRGSPPFPALVDLHSHGGMYLFGKEKVVDLGDNHPAMIAYHESNYDGRPTATELVRRGYIVIAADAFYFGERRLQVEGGEDRSKLDTETVKRLNQRNRAKEATLAKGLALAGSTWPGIVAWDDMRTIDYLLSRPEVDAKRIGCLGISMGGYRSMLLAALDERVHAAVITGFMSTVRPMLQSHLEIHSHVHFVEGLHRDLDWPDVAAVHAPRPLLVQQCSQDALFPLSGMQAAVRRIEAAYGSADARDKFSGRFYDVPHRFTRAMQDDAFAWLDEHLKRS
jgi:dienelactone hydrolase